MLVILDEEIEIFNEALEHDSLDDNMVRAVFLYVADLAVAEGAEIEEEESRLWFSSFLHCFLKEETEVVDGIQTEITVYNSDLSEVIKRVANSIY